MRDSGCPTTDVTVAGRGAAVVHRCCDQAGGDVVARVEQIVVEHPGCRLPSWRHPVTLPNVPAAPPIEGLTHVYTGKVRDLYRYPDGRPAASWRATGSPRTTGCCPPRSPTRAAILTAMTLWWFEQLQDLVPNHLISTDVPDAVAGRAMVTERLEMFPVECVARGYLDRLWARPTTGHRRRSVALPFRRGWSTRLGCPSRSSPRRPRPISVSTTRTSTSTQWSRRSVRTTPRSLRDLTLGVYAELRTWRANAASSWLTPSSSSDATLHLATIVLADEVLTPDSSRFWPADHGSQVTRSQASTSSSSATG